MTIKEISVWDCKVKCKRVLGLACCLPGPLSHLPGPVSCLIHMATVYETVRSSTNGIRYSWLEPCYTWPFIHTWTRQADAKCSHAFVLKSWWRRQVCKPQPVALPFPELEPCYPGRVLLFMLSIIKLSVLGFAFILMFSFHLVVYAMAFIYVELSVSSSH
jgi:hypothetical protein